MTAAKPNFYRILSVPQTATGAEIRTAYRNLAKRWHPDINGSKQAAAQFIAVKEAYEALSDPEKRRQYDLSRKRRVVAKSRSTAAPTSRPRRQRSPQYRWQPGKSKGGPAGYARSFDELTPDERREKRMLDLSLLSVIPILVIAVLLFGSGAILFIFAWPLLLLGNFLLMKHFTKVRKQKRAGTRQGKPWWKA